MEERVKYAVFLVVVILVSVCSSYITTSLMHPNTQSNGQASNSQATSTTLTKIFPNYTVTLGVYPDCVVTVTSNQIIHNLTITYKYTRLSDETNQTDTVSYGDYYPVWGAGQTLQAGANTPYMRYQIPADIIYACSRQVGATDKNGDTYSTWAVSPQLNVTEVSGYS